MTGKYSSLIKRIERLLPLLFLMAVALFFVAVLSIISFLFAITPEEALKSGLTPIPAGWEAGVFSHGTYYRWLTIAKHPILFGLSVIGFFSAWVFIIFVVLTRYKYFRKRIRSNLR